MTDHTAKQLAAILGNQKAGDKKKPPGSVCEILETYIKDIQKSVKVINGRVYVDWKTADADLRANTDAYAEAEIKRLLEQSLGPTCKKKRKTC